MRGNAMSSAKRVWPLHFARASTLRKGLPTTLFGLPLLPLFIAIDDFPGRLGLLAAHPRRRQLDGLVDFNIAGTATEIARERLLYLCARRAGIMFEQFFGREQKAGRAVTALGRAEVGKGLLQRVHLVAFGHAFDGRDLAALGVEPKHQAREHGLAIHEDGADAAFAQLAAVLGAG